MGLTRARGNQRTQSKSVVVEPAERRVMLSGGATLVKGEVAPTSNANFVDIVDVNGEAVFIGVGYGSQAADDIALWRSDGTEAGTVQIRDGSGISFDLMKFGDAAYFTRCFTKRFGVAPAAYRRREGSVRIVQPPGNLI